MAGIDKTYAKNYEEYLEFYNWVKTQTMPTYLGIDLPLTNYVYGDITEDMFNDDNEVSVMNTGTFVDAFLIQNCKVKFVADRMREVYGKNSYEKLQDINLSEVPEGWEKGRSFKIEPYNNESWMPLWNRTKNKNSDWWLQSKEFSLRYSTELKCWTSYGKLPTNTNTQMVRTIRHLKKSLKSQYLPKGVKFDLIGNYNEERYLITTL